MTPEEVASAAGVVATKPPRAAHCNLFKGAAYPIAHDHQLISCWGGWGWLPTGPQEDGQLRAAFDARDEETFKKRANYLRLRSDDAGNHTTPSQQWTMCSMRKGDLIIVRDSYTAQPPARGPTKFLIGVFSTEVDEPHGTVWARCRDYGIAPTSMANPEEVHRLRMWRPVIWVREGDWQGELAQSTVAAMAGVQSKTITVFTASMHAVLDMLKKSRPFAPSGMSSAKQPAPPHGTVGSVQRRLLKNTAPMAPAASGSLEEQLNSSAQPRLTAVRQKRPREEEAAGAPVLAQPVVNDQDCPLVCPIDQDGHMKEPVSLPCGCNFEKSAIKDWLKRESTCPTCRKQLPRGFDANTLGVNKLIQQHAALLCKCTQ